jgi:uncharacterized protein (TIGR02246 family)
MEETVKRSAFDLAEALTRGDAAGAAALYADDGKLLTSEARVISGRKEIEAYWRAGITFGLARVELHLVELDVDGGMAVEIGRYVLAVDSEGTSTADRGKYLALHRRQRNGSWLRAVDVFNPDTPPVGRHDSKEDHE